MCKLPAQKIIPIFENQISIDMKAQEFYNLREDFHQHPELSGQEMRTASKIVEVLKELRPTQIHTHIGGHGVIAEYTFSPQGPTLLFRADIDAVAINETLPCPYHSVNPGVSHKCGHDGHTTILVATAHLLHQHPLKRGRVLLLFQPAEETGQGARQVLQHLFFQDRHIDKAYALHNLPGFPAKAVVCREGSFTCSVISCSIKVEGKTSHAAEPEKAVSPTAALLKILEKAMSWNQGQPYQPEYFRSTLIELHIGEEAYGVAAGNGVIRLTLRASTAQHLKIHTDELEKLIQQLKGNYPALRFSTEWLESFTANENQTTAVHTIKQAAIKNGLTYIETPHPFTWGEDFGLFTQHIPGAMFGLGAGEQLPGLHTPAYDFPNTIIETGAQMFYQIAVEETEKE